MVGHQLILSSVTAKYFVIVVPGNPGVIGYYEQFMQHLFDKGNGMLDVAGESHLGHCPPCSGRHYSFKETIQHHLSVFDSAFLDKRNKEKKFVLVGHSVGAFICLQQRPNHNIHRVCFLYPTLEHIRKTPQGRLVQYITYPFPRFCLASMATLFSYARSLNSEYVQKLVSFCTGQETHDAKTTTECLLKYPFQTL